MQAELRLERYKLVTERQVYFTNLAKETFIAYCKGFAGGAVAAVALLSLQRQLEVDAGLVKALLHVIWVLIAGAGVVASFQIGFCVYRWYGFRRAECEINREAPKAERWAGAFEYMYIVGIAVSVVVSFEGMLYLERALKEHGIVKFPFVVKSSVWGAFSKLDSMSLYRKAADNTGSRIRVATFDSFGGLDLNKGNCEVARKALEGQSKGKLTYWCEKPILDIGDFK